MHVAEYSASKNECDVIQMALIWQVRQKRSALALFARIRTCRQPKLWRKVAAFCMETNKGAFCHLSDGWRGKLSCLSSQIANSYECSSSWTAYNSIQRCWCRRIYMTGNSARRKEEVTSIALLIVLSFTASLSSVRSSLLSLHSSLSFELFSSPLSISLFFKTFASLSA